MRSKFKLCDPMPQTFNPKGDENGDGEYYYDDGSTPGGSDGEEYYYSGEKNNPSPNQGGGFQPPMAGKSFFILNLLNV